MILVVVTWGVVIWGVMNDMGCNNIGYRVCFCLFLFLGENPFMRMRSVYVTYVVYKYVTFRTLYVLNVLAAVQQGRQVNLMI